MPTTRKTLQTLLRRTITEVRMTTASNGNQVAIIYYARGKVLAHLDLSTGVLYDENGNLFEECA